MSGFTYCNKHCSEFGIGYNPDATARMLDMPEYDLMELTTTLRDGGYYYGNRAKYRDFTQSCYFEAISEETFEAITRWLHRDSVGELRFDDRPYVYYRSVRPNKPPTGKIYPASGPDSTQRYYSGTMQVFLRAYEPLGVMDVVSLDSYGDAPEIVRGTGIILTEQMPAVTTDLGTHLVYNPGTEYTDTIIRIGGSAPNGVRIINRTTGDICSFVSLPTNDDYLELNSYNGKIRRLPSAADDVYYEGHDEGFVKLAPCGEIYRNIEIQIEEGNNKATLVNYLASKSDEGRYIYIPISESEYGWRKILYVEDESTIVLSEGAAVTATANDSVLVTMNELELEGDGATLTRFEVEYKPYVR